MGREVLIGLLKSMLTIRLFELKAAEVFSRVKIPGGGKEGA